MIQEIVALVQELSVKTTFRMDSGYTEYWQQIKTFRLKCILLAGKIIRSARQVVLKLPEQYAHQPIFSQI